ncbi:NAD(P)H:quinone oxidoreductase [Kibdelosporangium persicum]|uniref:TrpR binding protein WrbA n=1 Tax=Kibdelosporangium persicum TaxID=2698649 RepID=A0ABX2F6S4_9PSEU|nr:NAD(P)H:quinone oxidoreductase [Kibdelosporangium persicum]NRN67058.1 TrpR binding protein WrbA [Kibdelosporangium persicum]
MSPRIAVVYYSATGNVHATAEAIAEGAADAGADVRLRRVAETAPDKAVDKNPDWRAHLNATASIPEATLDDLTWADGYAFGTPTRYGNIAAQLKAFIDTTGGVWEGGHLANKPVTGFTSTGERHGGQESTLLSLYNVMYHWGSIIVPTGYVDYDIIHAAGGNPYGVSHIAEHGLPGKETIVAAKFQGGRLARITELLTALRAA